MAQARIFPPDRADDGRGSYEMVDILAIGKRVVFGARDASTRSGSPVSLYSLLRNKLPLSCAVLVSSARYRGVARCYNEREGSPSALGRHPPPRDPPRALNINRSAAERSAARGASRSRRISRRCSRQPTANPYGISHVDDHSEERSVVREGRQLPSPSPRSDSSR